MAKKETTRILLELGYTKLILPEGMSAEIVRDLVNAMYANYATIDGKTKYYKNPSSSSITIQIIPQDSITQVVKDIRTDSGNVEDKNFLADEIISRIKNKKINKTLIFTDVSIKIDDKEIEWPEIGDPEFDPEVFIEEILGYLRE